MVCKSNVILHRQSLAKALFMGIAGLLTVSPGMAEEAVDSPATEIQARTAPCHADEYGDFDFYSGQFP